MISFKNFILQRLPEALFVIATAVALFSTLSFGFHVEDATRANWPLIVGWVAVLVAILTVATYNVRTLIAGGIGTVVVGVAGIAVASSVSGMSPFAEEYGSLGFFVMLGFIVAALSYLMTRRKSLTLLYLVLGAFICVLIQFMYKNGLLAQDLLFLVGGLGLYVKSSQQAAVGDLSQGTSDRLSALLVGLVLCAVAAVISLGIWFVVIAPLNPPALELKLITKYYALEEIHVSGMEEIEHKLNQDMETNQTKEGDEESNKENSTTEESKGTNGQTDQGTDVNGFDDPAGAVRYFIDFPMWVWWIGLAVVLVVLAIASKKALRLRRFKKMCSLPPEKQIAAFYFFYQKRFKRLGFVKDSASTPIAYAQENVTKYAPFEEGAEGATYLALAKTYCGYVYGRQVPSEEDLLLCKRLYGVFYKNALRYVGRIKYCFTKYFLL